MEPVWKTRLREQMLDKGFTMKTLSLASGQNETYIRDVLERDRTPAVDRFVSIANALGVRASYLLGEDAAVPAAVQQQSAEAQLRSSLLAYGVDAADLRRILVIVKGFVDDYDETPAQSPRRARSEPASRPRAKAPSR